MLGVKCKKQQHNVPKCHPKFQIQNNFQYCKLQCYLLIGNKKSLLTCEMYDQVAHGLGQNTTTETESPSKQNMVTRKAGGQKEAVKEMQVCNLVTPFLSLEK